ncbi:MAG: GAF domain-containing protein [Anaerolineae bacterium]|nr:GAF domain-containing protein [Anaerolineae bacterium]
MIDTEQSYMEKSSRQLTLFQAVNDLVTSDDTVENILQDVLHILIDTLGYATAQIYQLSITGEDIWLYLESGLSSKSSSTQNLTIFSFEEENSISEALKQDKVIYIPDVTQSVYEAGQDQNSHNSELILPLKYRETFLGALCFQAETANNFDEEDIKFLQTVTKSIAFFMAHNRTIYQLEDSIQEARTLYNLQNTASESQNQPSKQKHQLGFQYDQHDISRIDSQPTEKLSEMATKNHDDRSLFLPIHLHGEDIGFLGVESDDDRADWTPDDISLLEEVGSQVALAIENAKLLEQTQERTQELAILFEATRQLTETIDLVEIYNILIIQIFNYLNCQRCSILELNGAETHFEERAQKVLLTDSFSLRARPSRFLTVDDFLPLQQMITKPKEIIFHLGTADSDPKLSTYLQQDKVASTLGWFPLIVRGKLIAILEVEHFEYPYPYTKNEIQLTKAIIAQVAVAIENAQLFQQTQEALAGTQKLFQISSALVKSVSLDDIFNIVLDNVKHYDVDRVSISLLDKSKEEQIESVTIASTWDRESSKNVPIGSEFSARKFGLVEAFAQPPFSPLISHDLRHSEQDERMDEEFRQFVLNELQAITLFSAPMFLGTEYKGVLSIYTRKPHTYTEQETRIYQTLADQAIIAIENHRLLETTKKERDRAALLYQLAQKLSSTNSVEDVQDVILSFSERIGATYTEIYITDGGAFLSVGSTIPQRQQMNADELARHAFLEGPEALALDRGERVIFNRINQQKWLLDKSANMPTVNMAVCVPFFSQRSILHGVLTFFHAHSDGFTEENLATFDAVAIQAATSLENVWLLEKTTEVLSETELLYKASRRFNTAQSVEDLLDIMVGSFAETTTIDYMHIALVNCINSGETLAGLNLIAGWSHDTQEILSTSITLPANEFTFIQNLRYDDVVEIHYETLPADTQAQIEAYQPGIRTILAVPLAVGRNWLGVLLFESKTERYQFKSNIINQIINLAGQAAVVIQNLQLVAETQQNLYNSEILSNLGQQLLKVETIEDIFDLAISAIAATEPDRGVSIFMYDQTRDSIDLELVALWDNPRKEWPSIPLSSHLSTEELGLVPLLRTGNTIVSSSIERDERFSLLLKQLFAVMQIKSMAAVPIWLNMNVEGFILAGNESEIAFSSEIIRLYENIARETSVALENRRLLDETEHRARQLQTAAEVSQAATVYLDLDKLLSEAVDLIKERFNFYHVSIFLVDDYRKYALVRASTGEIGQKMLAMKHKLEVGGQSIVGTATETGQPYIAMDTGTHAIHFNNPLLPNAHSEMALPLTAQGRIIGALDVQSIKRSAFDESDITILQSMANQLANAIQAARAVQELNSTLDEVNKMHRHYVENQWATYIREQRAATQYRLTENGVTLDEEGMVLPGTSKAIVEKKAVVVPATRSILNEGTQKLGDHRLTNGKSEQDSTRWTRPLPERTSSLIVPLTLNGQAVIGTIDFELPQSTLDAIWEDDTLQIIEAITNQAAQAIESARLFEQTQISREEAEALYEVGRILVATEDEREMFNTVLGKMLSTLGLKQGGILLFEEDRRYGKLHALFENGKPVMKPRLRIPIEDNPSYQRLIETKQPVPIEDVSTDPLVASVREINIPRGIVSLLLVPIIIDDEVIGAIGADSLGKKHIFTESEINLAVAMADQLSITLQNRRLIEETKKRAILLQTSADVGRAATGILDQAEMLDEAVQLIKERFNFYHVQIFLVDEAEQYAVLHKSTGETGRRLLEMHYKVAIGSKSVIGQVTAQRKPIVTRSTDIDTQPIYTYHRNELLPETEAELAIPLQVGDRLIGVLDVQSTSPQAFTEDEISTLDVLAAQLAIAIENAKAFKEQQETAERLKEIDKLKTQFLANMSHELRTPLNSIIGFSRVILKGIDGPLTELQKTDLTSIHNSGQHLLGLINNILDLSKIEAGKMELNFEETEIEPIIKTVMSTAMALVKDKSVSLKQEIPQNLPTIWADPTRIRQVILNLVSNACKFTEEGSVTTLVKVEQDYVVFSVIDTGIGIPDSKLSNIFEEFTQVDASTTRKAGGTGLGLPISRHFVEMHQGKIWVDSTPNKGSIFSFSIPIKAPNNDVIEIDDFSLSLADNTPPTEKEVLVIDDDPGVIALYKRFLEKQHYQVTGLEYTEDVVSQIKKLSPFAILLDVIIPDKDGWSLLKELKEDQVTKDIPIVVCSIASDKNRGFSLGATNYLIKPIVEDELIEALSHIDKQQNEAIKVLIVDDKADDILLTRRILEAQDNYIINEASNGKEGLKIVESTKPDLIILDLNMPEMDGFTMIENLKGDEKTRSIPIIIVSGEQLTVEQQTQLTGQVEALLHKAIFTENELLEDISQALDRLRQEEKKRSKSKLFL